MEIDPTREEEIWGYLEEVMYHYLVEVHNTVKLDNAIQYNIDVILDEAFDE